MIELVMPVMRLDSALEVLKSLNKQTMLIDKLTLIDNNGSFELNDTFLFPIEIIKPKENIGTNASWNYMFESKADLVGMIGDDYFLEDHLIEILYKSIGLFPEAGAVTATIFKDKPVVKRNPNNITGNPIIGKGHFGVALIHKCLLDCIPLIPKDLFIFYGDNWLGYWLLQLGYTVFEVSAGISHYYQIDLKDKLNYKAVSRREKTIWEDWKASKIEL